MCLSAMLRYSLRGTLNGVSIEERLQKIRRSGEELTFYYYGDRDYGSFFDCKCGYEKCILSESNTRYVSYERESDDRKSEITEERKRCRSGS